MTDDYVTTQEFGRYCQQQNGSLKRIENQLDRMSEKLDKLAAEGHKRVSMDTYLRDREELMDTLDKLRGRPSWAVGIIITLMSSALVAMLVLVLTQAL